MCFVAANAHCCFETFFFFYLFFFNFISASLLSALGVYTRRLVIVAVLNTFIGAKFKMVDIKC